MINIRLCLALMALGAVLVILLSVPADADPATEYAATTGVNICSFLDAYPSPRGVDAVLDGLQRDGASLREAGRVLVAAVNAVCPWHLSLLIRYAAPAPAGVMV